MSAQTRGISLAPQHARPDPRRNTARIRGAALAVAIGTALAWVAFTGFSGGFQ